MLAAKRIAIALLVMFVELFSFLKSTRDNTAIPAGHGEELGRHRMSDGHIDVLDSVPNPQDFWTNYVSIRKPVIFRGAAKNFPAFNLWTDEYLRENYGDLEVKLEAKKEKETVPVGIRGLGRDTLQSFLESYQRKDSYIVSQLPDPLAKEVRVLPCWMCGSFKDRILEANLWLSSGGTRSMLHKDADSAINCLLNGTKDWILIHPRNEENIPVAEGDRGYGGFAVVDVDHVNLIKHPQFKNVHWQYANMTPGDCLYLPYSYWHQVRSYGRKNMAVSVLISRLKDFNSSGCEAAKLNYTPLSDVNMVWTYPGHGPQTMGNLDPFEVKDSYIELVERLENGHLRSIDLFEHFAEGGLVEEDEIRWREIAQKILDIIDPDQKGYATKEDIYGLTMHQLKGIADATDPDPANTEEYEHVVFNVNEIREVFGKALLEGKGMLTLENLVRQYEAVGGSAKVARELYSMLNPENKNYVTAQELQEHLDASLKLYEKTYLHEDQSGSYYEQQMAEDKEIMAQTLPKDKRQVPSPHDEF